MRARFPQLEPVSVFASPEQLPTVNMVTDSVSPGSLYGGVATASILSALLAARLSARLRIVTRTEYGDAARIAKILKLNRIRFEGPLEMLHVGIGDDRSIPVGDDDIFVTTSWWTTAPIVGAIGHKRVVYLLQEDERMFYSRGYERLRCSEVIADERLHTLVNTELLFRYLADGPEPLAGLRARAASFEPAFPDSIFYDDPSERVRSRKLNFLFYARPNNQRNLYWRGMEAIELALLENILDPARWRFTFVGKDLPVPSLPGDPEWANYENLPWEDYARLVRSAHVGMSLIDTPHPSYPPLDLAASGAAVVTNTFGMTKMDLTAFSKNIITAPPTDRALADAIARAIVLQADTDLLTANYRSARLERDWEKALLPSMEKVMSWTDF